MARAGEPAPARVKVYVEGGGSSDDLRTRCRQAFSALLERAGFRGRMPQIVACGTRRAAFDRFRGALEQGEPALLLVDSEGPVTGVSAWTHVRDHDRWQQPPTATEDDLHLMVECMEAWLLADQAALAGVFGRQLRPNSLPGKRAIEEIPKRDVMRGLANATRDCVMPYDKAAHSFRVLAQVDPARLRAVAPWAARFFDGLDTRRPRP